MRKAMGVVLASAALFFAPSVWLHLSTPIVPPSKAGPANVALIFGAVVRNGTISPLHQERLDAGIALFRTGTVARLVVSNTPAAAEAMRKYLNTQGIPAQAIELDTQAVRSPDTCSFEAGIGAGRSVLLISQRFHLPRLALHCRRYALHPQYVMADSPTRAPNSLSTKVRVRTGRFIRETMLIWGTLLRIYPHHPIPQKTVKRP
ncbi:MAG: YdcF family protein [Litoreibacter sp.]|uniref:YdcF family protein n=1 Tax=Litoreibacter sp. TaxID=1969459 RepID=UPI0032987B03